MVAYSQTIAIGSFKEVETLAWFDGTNVALDDADRHVLFDDSDNFKVTRNEGTDLYTNEVGANPPDLRFEGLSTPTGIPSGTVYTRLYLPDGTPGGTIGNTGQVELQYMDANGIVIGSNTLWLQQGLTSFGRPATQLVSETGYVVLTDAPSNELTADANMFIWGPEISPSATEFVAADENWIASTPGGLRFGLLDGFVDGTSADDTIDSTYLGDANGDRVDNFDDYSGTSNFATNNDEIRGFGGNDTINAGSGHDTVYGGTGDDTIYGGDGFNRLYGEEGNDTFYANGNNDEIIGGADADTFIITGVQSGFSFFGAVGGSTGLDNETLDLSALIQNGFRVVFRSQAPETNGNPGFNGSFRLENRDGSQSASISYSDIENLVVCFAAGTLIRTIRGDVPIEDLIAGDQVQTMDHGYQTLRWIGSRRLSGADLLRKPKLKPIRIAAGALGEGVPKQDLIVSRQHRVLVCNAVAERMFGSREILVAAHRLLSLPGVAVVQGAAHVTYFHMLFDAHQIVFSNGAAMESLFTGPEALQSLSPAARAEIETLFPDICAPDFVPAPVRPIPDKGRRIATLTARLLKNNQPVQDQITHRAVPPCLALAAGMDRGSLNRIRP